MKIKEGYIKVQSAEGWAVTAVGEEGRKNKIMIILNRTAAEIWDLLAEGKTPEEIAAILADRYGIPSAEAREDVQSVTDILLREGVVSS